MEHLASTTFEIDGNYGMDGIETFFIQIGAEIKTRKTNSLRASVEHPDGFGVHIKVKCHEKKYMEVNRRGGDTLLFHLLYQMLIAYDFGHGDNPSIYPGQLCPRVKMTPQEPPMSPPDFCLDLYFEA